MSTTEDINSIIKNVLETAERLLKEYGEFYPFAVALEDGKTQLVSVYEGQEYPNAKAYYETLVNQMNERYKSYGIGLNVGNGDKKTAIQIKLIYAGDEYEDSFIPYELEAGKLSLGSLYTSES